MCQFELPRHFFFAVFRETDECLIGSGQVLSDFGFILAFWCISVRTGVCAHAGKPRSLNRSISKSNQRVVNVNVCLNKMTSNIEMQGSEDHGEHFCCMGPPGLENRILQKLLLRKLILHSLGNCRSIIWTRSSCITNFG